jgi:hypothetical protein
MVAPTGVNEGTPQEPATVEPPGPVTAGLAQAEAMTENPAGPAADLKELAGDLEETAPGGTGPAGSAATKSVPPEAAPAQAEPADAELTEAGPAQLVAAEPEPAEAAGAEPQRTEAEPPKEGPNEAELAKPEPAKPELTEADLSEPDLTEAKLAEKGLAEAGEPDLAGKQGNRAGQAQEAAEAQGASEAREGSRDVGPLAVVGIIVGVIVLVGVAAGILAMVTHGFKPKTVVTYRPAAVYGLRPGQCINAGSNSLSFTLVSCASPHDAEVFARFSLPAAAWPGSSAVRQEAGDGCASRLSGYLNPRFASIGLTQEYVYPNRDAWQAGQRTVVCEVSSGSGRLTGSVRAKS